MTARLAFDVVGTPVVKGNLRSRPGGSSYYPNGRAIEEWAKAIRDEAREAISTTRWTVLREAVSVSVLFRLPRPKSHYRADGVTLKPSAPAFPHGRVGDVDKFARAVLDPLTDLVYSDDAQAVDLISRKRYVHRWMPGGAAIEISEMLP